MSLVLCNIAKSSQKKCCLALSNGRGGDDYTR
nr:MAG TPA: hypothetical protein [Caudoviricetes sp.]